MAKAVLVDITKCVGCGGCTVACKLYNELTWKEKEPQLGEKANLSANNWTVVQKFAVDTPETGAWRYIKRQCMHCLEPACESACFTHSFVKTKEGAVIYKPTELKQDFCVGCRYCMIACPFDIPKFEWDKALPFVRKCRFCNDRLKAGETPACVAVCPTGALKFGEREELLAEAGQRLNASPYYVKHIYGEKEYGGTSWLYLSDVPFEKIGLKTTAFEKPVSEEPIPLYSWNVLKWTPYIFVGWGAILTALRYYTKRKVEVHEEEMYAAVETKENMKENMGSGLDK
ncbi:MAG TPA: (4Fe-4S)-binding protein [Desulfotomaculum sp.]|nr:(4Fe-4S)-binding protein [Desulfotomaculum sp.]